MSEKMLTIALLGQKGGSGKTTVATALSVQAVKKGKSVALIDLDPQGSASKWAEIRQNESPAVISCQLFMLEKMIEQARIGGADFVFIDTPGKIEQAAIEAAKVADFVLIPVRATAFDVNALKELRNLLAIANDPPSYVVINAAPAQGTRHKDAKATIEGMHNLKVAPVYLCQRNAYADATIIGQTASEYEPKGKAAEEIEALYSLIISATRSLKNEKESSLKTKKPQSLKIKKTQPLKTGKNHGSKTKLAKSS
jgi:chromosome partitioning protein